MGKLNVKFLYEGQDVKELPEEQRFEINPLWFEIQYNTDKINEIEFDGDDHTIGIDFQNLSNDFNWNSIEYPNQMVKEKVLEIVYYRSIQTRLEKILHDILICRFDKRRDDRYELESLADSALNILNNTKESEYFQMINAKINDGIRNINHTINAEVKHVIKYTKHNASEKQKIRDMNDAKRHLKSDLGDVIHWLKYYKVNDGKILK